MLKALSVLGLVGLLGGWSWGEPLQIKEPLAWEKTTFFQLPPEPNPEAEQVVQKYLQDLRRKGYVPDRQGIWLQSGMTRLAVRHGLRAMSAASLTKIATTIASLHKWPLSHQFETLVYTKGTVTNGILQGDLIIVGGGDPFFVWEEAIALANTLQQLGLKEVQGNLIITGAFYMNYKTNPQVAGELLKQAFKADTWSKEAAEQYAQMEPGTAKPSLKITGPVKVASLTLPPTPLLRHQSVSLGEILKQMNIYSNNVMAQVLGESVGGAKAVASLAAEAAGVPPSEIQLVNGSGLGVANRISPRTAVAMLMALDRQLTGQPIGLAGLFPVSGRDKKGTMLDRHLPQQTLLKTGTLATVSALAGALPTRKHGLVWFAIINEGGNIVELRAQQDIFLQNLARVWGITPLPMKGGTGIIEKLGDPQRITKVGNL